MKLIKIYEKDEIVIVKDVGANFSRFSQAESYFGVRTCGQGDSLQTGDTVKILRQALHSDYYGMENYGMLYFVQCLRNQKIYLISNYGLKEYEVPYREIPEDAEL
jgi:hypothetical protein